MRTEDNFHPISTLTNLQLKLLAAATSILVSFHLETNTVEPSRLVVVSSLLDLSGLVNSFNLVLLETWEELIGVSLGTWMMFGCSQKLRDNLG